MSFDELMTQYYERFGNPEVTVFGLSSDDEERLARLMQIALDRDSILTLEELSYLLDNEKAILSEGERVVI